MLPACRPVASLQVRCAFRRACGAAVCVSGAIAMCIGELDTSLPASQRCPGTVTPVLYQARHRPMTAHIECWGLGIRCTLQDYHTGVTPATPTWLAGGEVDILLGVRWDSGKAVRQVGEVP